MNVQLQSILSRFNTLYPRLIKAQQTLYHAGQNPLTVQDQIKLCKSLAKSESIALLEEANIATLASLESEVAKLMQIGEMDFSKGKGARELFLIYLYMFAQQKAQDPCKGFMALIMELLKHAQNHIINKKAGMTALEQAKIIQKSEEGEGDPSEMNFDIDISLKNDDQLQSVLEVISQVQRKLMRLGEDPILLFLSTLEAQIAAYLATTKGQILNLDLFAPASLVYRLLENLLRDPKVQFTPNLLSRLDKLLHLTFKLFDVYKLNSKYFMITLHSSSKYEEDKTVRRMSVLFTDLLDLLVGFCCQYLRTHAKLGTGKQVQQGVELYRSLFQDQGEEYFTLRERLRILIELNSIFNQIPEIINADYYWGIIRDGLFDPDNYCRKVSMAVLKNNLKSLGQESIYKGILTQQEFETHWTTFFDLYDTLESFGSHLTKAVWARIEVFYSFIQKNYDTHRGLHPLMDFKQWLMVLYKRVQSHMNLKLRRYVQKSTLKRKYMTTHMKEYVFDEFLRSLNKGLIFKDANIYTQFSQKNQLINGFYETYFTKECVDLTADLSQFFKAFAKHVSHPQLILCSMRNLARDYPTMKGQAAIEGYLGNAEIAALHEVTNSYFGEQVFSSKYLCWKYILAMLSLYLRVTPDLNLSSLLKLLGKMPVEFFSNQAYQDREAQQSAITLIKRIGEKAVFTDMIGGYISDLFQVKAIVQQMPKFGKEINLIIDGVSRLILVISLPPTGQQVSDPNQHAWLRDIMRPNWDALSQILGSAYLSPEVLDSKVRYLSVLYQNLYKHGDDGLRQVLRQDFIPRTLHLVLERLENNLLVPLSKYDVVQHQPSELTKVFSIFAQLTYYLKYLQFSITACHIHMNQANSALEKTLKQILQLNLAVGSLAGQSGPQADPWGAFLMQYVLTRCLRTVTKCYSKGIQACLARGITYFMVAEDVFTFGKPLLQALVEFRQIARPKESEDEISDEQKRFLIDNDLTLTKMQQAVFLSQWKVISDLIKIFKLEAQAREELLRPLYPVISEKAADFLAKSTKPYYSSLFRVLKDTYIPVLLERLPGSQDPQGMVRDYQNICWQCWNIIKELQTEFDVATLQEFIEFAFSAELISLQLQIPNLDQEVYQFHEKMSKEISEQGDRYWLITRTAFNHILAIISGRPSLLPAFYTFVGNFATCREVRSLDSEIMLYKMNTLIPQALGDTESLKDELNMEEISYQGAFVRTSAMLILEELVNRHKRWLLQGGELDPQLLAFTDGLEKLIMWLIDLNYSIKFVKASMPYSDGHRLKVRAWQTLVVLLEYLDPAVYTRLPHHARFLAAVNQQLWKVIALNHLPSIRAYIDIVMIKFSLMYPQYSIEDPNFIRTLLDPNIKVNVASSHLVIAGFVMQQLDGAKHGMLQLKQKLLEHMSGFLTSNGAHVRCIAQYFVHHLCTTDPSIKSLLPQGMATIVEYLVKNRDTQKLIQRYHLEIMRMHTVLSIGGVKAILSTPIDQQGEFLSQPFVERIKEVTSEVMSEIRNKGEEPMPIKRESLWKEELKARQDAGEANLQINEASQSNYQRKILPWEQVEYDHELLKRVFESRQRNEIIMCAALIDKIPNLAGLARTSEIMNASSLVINNRSVCQTEEFKGVSVTSEKWLPIYEVQEKDLYNYLVYQKSNGYKILGLEQTANSKMLNEYKFPAKCVMLLGKEKEGIPQEFLALLDECIEIPQFGVIRSLNVHVSGALCLWEYTKQHLPASSSSKRD